MQKILYAIQQKDAENYLQQQLEKYDIISTGAVAYREAIVTSLREHPSDILLYRESLKGSVPTFELMQQLRKEFPTMRIVFMANEQPVTSKLLSELVCLGIYDIINSNAPNIKDILNFIIEPRDYAYASKFFHAEYMSELVPQPTPAATPAPDSEKKRSGLSGFVNKLTGKSAPSEPKPTAPVVKTTSGPIMPATPVVKTPEVDFETMRGAMLEDCRRTAQREIPQLVKMQVEVETSALRSDLSQRDETIINLKRELKEKAASEESLKKQLSDASTLRKSLETQLDKLRSETELTTQTYQAQLASLQTTRSPEWYQDQTKKWIAERDALKSKITTLEQTVQALTAKLQTVTSEKEQLTRKLEEKTRETEALQLAIPRDLSTVVDDTLENDFVILPDDDSNVRQPLAGAGQVIAFMGTKHGVGNTTAALNTAIALASCGYKTLFIELNRHFPMINEFFDFTNIVRGLDVAINALESNNMTLASQCIIKPHGVRTTKRPLQKVYQRLPGPLHFMLYSNNFLLRCKTGEAPHITETELKDLIYFLTRVEHYSYIIVDLQPDDQLSVNTFLNSSIHVNQLVLTMTQDPHSITTAGYMITSLARGYGASLLRNAEFLVNQYSSSNQMTLKKIADFLHVPTARISKLSIDSKGYMDAAYSAVPYSLSKGKFSNEYIDLRMKLST